MLPYPKMKLWICTYIHSITLKYDGHLCSSSSGPTVNFREICLFKLPILWLQVFKRSYEKTLHVILKWPPGYVLGTVTKEHCFFFKKITIAWVPLSIIIIISSD